MTHDKDLLSLVMDNQTKIVDSDPDGEGFRVPEAYESLSCRNPRSAAELYGDLMISAWALEGLRAVRQPVDDGAGRTFRSQASSPSP